MYRFPRRWITFSSATILALLVAFATAQARPSVNKATGGGTYEKAGFLNTIAFTAQVDESGEVKGQAQFQLRDLDLRIHLDVDCLVVVGNQAWIGGVVKNSSNPALVGTRFVFTVVDNGEGQGAVDELGEPAGSVLQSDCLTQPALPLLPLTNGNFQVR